MIPVDFLFVNLICLTFGYFFELELTFITKILLKEQLYVFKK